MAKPKGSSSFQSLTIEQLSKILGGRLDIPVRVSKKWLDAANELLGNVPEAEAEAESEAPEVPGKSALDIEE